MKEDDSAAASIMPPIWPPPRRTTRNTARKSIASPPPPHKTLTLTLNSTITDNAENSSVKTLAPNLGFVSSDSGSVNFDENASVVHVENQNVTGKRRIIKKTVRVVKRVIKRRVPKRVLKDGLEDGGSVERAGEVTGLDHVSELIENASVVGNVVGRDDVVDVVEEISKDGDDGGVVTEHCSVANDLAEKRGDLYEVSEKLNVVDEIKGVLSLDSSGLVSEPIVCGKGGADSMEMETSKFSCGAAVLEPMIDETDHDLSGIGCVETKTLISNDGAHVPEPRVSEKVNDQNAINTIETDTMKSNDVASEVDRKDLNVHTPDSLEVNMVNYAAESTVGSAGIVGIEDLAMEKLLEDSVIENQNMDVISEENVGLATGQDVDPARNVVLVQEKDESLGKPESSNAEVDSHSIGLNDLLLSGEMEALERRKRRRTEIFVGGLAKETKEEDIRKVFEEIGAILEVRLVMNLITGKNRGFAFLRFATAADAKNALAKYSKVEICGKQCKAEAVEGNDTIFLGNIDRKWKTEDVLQLLQKAGIKEIDKVTVKADPNNIERNRGFAFVELETSRHAQNAFDTLQKKNVLGNQVKVAWAQPLNEPAEEEILKVKSVYAEYLPSSWDEGKVREYFKRFGEIENVVLAKDLNSSKRNDFAFINYTNRDAALACIETVSRERSEDDGSKAKIAVSLAKPRSMQIKQASDPAYKQLPKEKPKASQSTKKLHEPRKSWKPASSTYHHAKADTRSSTTDELVQLLRQQASSRQIPVYPSTGPTMRGEHFPLPGSKRPFPLVGHDPLYLEPRGPLYLEPRGPLYLEPRGLPRPRMESSYPGSGISALAHGFRTASVSNHQQEPRFTSEFPEPVNRRTYPRHFQVEEQAPYHGNNNLYHRYGWQSR